VQIHFILLFKR